MHRALSKLCRKGDLPCPSAAELLRPLQHHYSGSQLSRKDVIDHSKEVSSVGSNKSSSSSSSSNNSADAPSAVREAGAAKEDQGQGEDGEPLRLRLYDCRAGGISTATGLRRVHAVMSQHWGYSLADYRLFDYAALLHRVSA